MLGIIFIEMFIAFIGWLLFRKNEKIYYAVSLLTTIMMFVFAVYMAISPDMVFDIDFICDQGIHLMSDGFRKVYSLIITFMWMMTMFLSRDYFRHHHKLSRYFFFNLMTEAATLGVFLSKDLFSCFVFFEVFYFFSMGYSGGNRRRNTCCQDLSGSSGYWWFNCFNGAVFDTVFTGYSGAV